jgi:HAD superfamily hydrolase (TIGR01509 family)
MREKLIRNFVDLLRKVDQERNSDFSGIGILIYDSSNFKNLRHLDLKPNFKVPKEYFINQNKTLTYLLEISKKDNLLHDGFHFFDEKGRLTHTSQFIETQIQDDIHDLKVKGARFVSALLASYENGIIATGVIGDSSLKYFIKGKIFNIEPMKKNQWNKIYKKDGVNYNYYDVINEPHRDMEMVSRELKKSKVIRVLDLGCGAGRNTWFLAEKGFDVYGFDLAKNGISLLKNKLNEKGLRANLIVGNMFEKLPYRDNFFDAVISVQVLQHGNESQINHVIKEIERILNPNGLIFVTLCGRYSEGKLRHCLVKTAKKIASNTYVPTIGRESGLTHFIYNKALIKKHYRNFKILKLWTDDKDYYCFLAKNNKRSGVKTIVFDYGGVIGNDPSEKIYEAVSRNLGINKNILMKNFMKFFIPLSKGKILVSGFWKHFSKSLDLSDAKKLEQLWLTAFRRYAKVNNKVFSCIKPLIGKFKFCLLSNNKSFYKNENSQRLLRKYFCPIVYSFEVGMRKPEKEIYDYILKITNSKPEETLFIDDDETKLNYPRKISASTLVFKNNRQLKEELNKI